MKSLFLREEEGCVNSDEEGRDDERDCNDRRETFSICQRHLLLSYLKDEMQRSNQVDLTREEEEKSY